RLSEKGLDVVEQHLAQFGDSVENTAMVQRLRSALSTGERVTRADANFCLHEASEATMMRRGLSYEEAHAAAIQNMEYRRTACTIRMLLKRIRPCLIMLGAIIGTYVQDHENLRAWSASKGAGLATQPPRCSLYVFQNRHT